MFDFYPIVLFDSFSLKKYILCIFIMQKKNH